MNIPLAVDMTLAHSSSSGPSGAPAGRKAGGHGVSEFTYLKALDQAIVAITGFAPDVLAVSAGFDTFIGDQVTTSLLLENGSHCTLYLAY